MQSTFCSVTCSPMLPIFSVDSTCCTTGLVGRDVDDVILERGGRLVRLLVHSQIVDLHPEVYLLVLIPLEQSRLAIRRSHARTNLIQSNYEASRAHILRWAPAPSRRPQSATTSKACHRSTQERRSRGSKGLCGRHLRLSPRSRLCNVPAATAAPSSTPKNFPQYAGSNSAGTSICAGSSKVCTTRPVSVVTRPKILTVPRWMPSLLTKVMSRYFT